MECVIKGDPPARHQTKVVVLLSGGMDSATCAALAKARGEAVIALSILYGQKHYIELEAAEAIAREMHVGLYRMRLPSNMLSGSALLDRDKSLPTGRSLEEMRHSGVAPSYVPARNTILIALAASFAEVQEAKIIYYGAHREDHVGYPDCRPEFVQAMGLAVMLGTAAGIRLEAPFIHASKADIIQTANSLGTPLNLSHSCYQGRRPACGVCDTCVIRIGAFKQAGFIDPIDYEIDIDWGAGRQFNARTRLNGNVTLQNNLPIA